MGLKQQLLDIVKSGYPDFNSETDTFEIEFEGGGDSFGSFYSISLYRTDDYQFNFEGEIGLDAHEDFFFSLLDESEVGYNWNDAGTTGRINYEDGDVNVTTLVSEEYYGSIDE